LEKLLNQTRVRKLLKKLDRATLGKYKLPDVKTIEVEAWSVRLSASARRKRRKNLCTSTSLWLRLCWSGVDILPSASEKIGRSLAKLPAQNAIIDGEVISVDAKGVSQFNQLLSRKGEPVFYAFDLLWLDGKDLRQMPPCRAKEATRAAGPGRKVLTPDLEGIVAKRKLRIYKDDGNSWLKNRTYSQAEGRHELLTRGR
jgi:hypothetical protein